MKGLPFVGFTELNKLVRFNWIEHGSYLTHPGYIILNHCILISLPSFVEAENYSPPPGMNEITEEEFNTIEDKQHK